DDHNHHAHALFRPGQNRQSVHFVKFFGYPPAEALREKELGSCSAGACASRPELRSGTVSTDRLRCPNMVKTLTRTGNSLALVLDRSILEATGIDADTKLEVSTDGDVIVVSPVRSKKRTARLRKVLDDLDREHAGAFRRLAD